APSFLPSHVREPNLPVRPVHRVRSRQGQGQEEGARAALVRCLLLLERLPLQPLGGCLATGFLLLGIPRGVRYPARPDHAQ
ncbi:unnamed protein product, partial [Ectocarpus sp. 12 AP-2014]